MKAINQLERKQLQFSDYRLRLFNAGALEELGTGIFLLHFQITNYLY